MFKLEFSTENAALKDPEYDHPKGSIAIEVNRILSMVARRVGALQTSGKIQDYNGNTVGKWSLTEESKS